MCHFKTISLYVYTDGTKPLKVIGSTLAILKLQRTESYLFLTVKISLPVIVTIEETFEL